MPMIICVHINDVTGDEMMNIPRAYKVEIENDATRNLITGSRARANKYGNLVKELFNLNFSITEITNTSDHANHIAGLFA